MEENEERRNEEKAGRTEAKWEGLPRGPQGAPRDVHTVTTKDSKHLHKLTDT